MRQIFLDFSPENIITVGIILFIWMFGLHFAAQIAMRVLGSGNSDGGVS